MRRAIRWEDIPSKQERDEAVALLAGWEKGPEKKIPIGVMG